MSRWLALLLTLSVLVVCMNTIVFFSLSSSQQIVSSNPRSEKLRVATYNLWNFMFHWPVRVRYIAEMVRFNDSQENKLVLCTRHSPIPAGTMKILLHDPDIIGFQEVRSRDGTMETNQLNDLASLLPEYPFSFYAKASDVTGGEGIEEGIALLSKHQIATTTIQKFSIRQGNPDLNQRVGIQATINTPAGPVDVYVTHFSYDRLTQCHNMADLVQFISNTTTEYPAIILGDLNLYNDTEYPVDVLIKPKLPNDHYCASATPATTQNHSASGSFADAWLMLHENKSAVLGYTFSNMPWPWMISRPDRVMYQPRAVDGASLVPARAIVVGSGAQYKRKHYWDVVFSRASIALSGPMAGLFSHIAFVVVSTIVLTAVMGAFLAKSRNSAARILAVTLALLLGYILLRLRPLLRAMFHPQQEDFNPSDHRMLIVEFQYRRMYVDALA